MGDRMYHIKGITMFLLQERCGLLIAKIDCFHPCPSKMKMEFSVAIDGKLTIKWKEIYVQLLNHISINSFPQKISPNPAKNKSNKCMDM